jgi:aminopeptidase N
MMRLVVASGLVHGVVGAAICAIGFATVAQGQGIGPRPNPREWSSGGPISPEQAAYDVTFYDLRLRVSPADSTIAGSLTVYARVIAPLEFLVLDLDSAFTVERASDVTAGGSTNLAVERRGGKLWIRLDRTRSVGETLGVAVAYHGRPRIAPRPPWIGGFQWARTPSGAPWIATTCVNEGADLWWPVKDHPSDKPDSVSLHITVPNGLVVATNGKSRGKRANADSTTTFDWHVSTPISMYNVALNIAPYRTITRDYASVTGEHFPVTYWVLPENYEKGLKLVPEMLEHLRFYERLLGPYPFRADKYGVAETPHLGMEHQTIIAYGNQYKKNEAGFDELHQHELAHEWFGNLITAKDWSDYWLHEGFGSYMQPLYVERLRGKAAYFEWVKRQMAGAKNRRAIAEPCCLTAGEVYFNPPDYRSGDGDIYGKASAVLHTLRYVLGDSTFFTVLRRFLYPTRASERVTDGSQVRLVSTDDFIRTAERYAKRPLGWFFDVYVRQPALPQIVVERTGDVLSLRWEAPGGRAFPMPIDVEIDGVTRRVRFTSNSAQLRVPATAQVRLDPRGWVFRVMQ